jgi:hypothetical protein
MLNIPLHAQVDSCLAGDDFNKNVKTCVKEEVQSIRAKHLGVDEGALPDIPSFDTLHDTLVAQYRTAQLDGSPLEPVEGLPVFQGWRCNSCYESGKHSLFVAESTLQKHLSRSHPGVDASTICQEAFIQKLNLRPNNTGAWLEVSFFGSVCFKFHLHLSKPPPFAISY